MNLQIVDFQIAKDLKELGFDYPTKYYYDFNGTLGSSEKSGVYWNVSTHTIYSAPTQAEVCRWLRDKHGYHIMISFYDKEWKADIIDMRIYENEIVADTELQETFEQAERAGVKEVIEILKEKNFLKSLKKL